jgi:hypothetical protein
MRGQLFLWPLPPVNIDLRVECVSSPVTIKYNVELSICYAASHVAIESHFR